MSEGVKDRVATSKDKLLAAFALGDVFAIGGSVYNARAEYVFSTSDLAELRSQVKFSRIDAGGRPTWRLNQ